MFEEESDVDFLQKKIIGRLREGKREINLPVSSNVARIRSKHEEGKTALVSRASL